jgi:hypothetical protein
MELMAKFNQSEIADCLHAPVLEPNYTWNASDAKKRLTAGSK